MLNTLQEQPTATLSMLRLNNPVLFSFQRLNTTELWKWRDYTQWNKEMLSRLYSHHKPVAEEEEGKGELGAVESICHLGHCMDASSIEEL